MENYFYFFRNAGSKIYGKVFGIFLAFFLLMTTGLTVNAQSGEALDFLGDDDYVALPINVNGSYTKEAWINPSNTAGFPNLISGSATALYLNNGTLQAGHASSGYSDLVDPGPAIPIGVWTHVAVTYDAVSGVMTLYRDGAPVASTINLNPYTETNLELGRFNFSSYYQGRMDEVRIWNVARTGAEILAGMLCEVNDDAPGLAAYYKFNQGVAGDDNTGVTTLLDSHDTCSPADGFLFGFALTPGTTSNWVAPGAFTPVYCNPAPNIRILGAGANCILDGDVTPDLTDGSDYGDIGATGKTQTFTIYNSGSATLNVTGVTSSNPADFTVTTLPASTVAPGASTTFTVTFNPSGTTGIKTATITVNNDDADEAVYDFSVQGNNAGGGEALDFDGIISWVDLPVTISGNYTKEVWINPTAASLANFPNLISGDNTTGTALYLNNGVLSAGHAPTFDQTSGGAPLTAGTWYHVAVTFDDATNAMNLYLNGVMVSSGTPPDYTETTLDLGIFAGTNLFAGKMDEVRIWNVARSAGEIAANMNCKLRGDEPGLIAYYDFNQGIAGGNNTSETTLLDRTDNCTPQNGTLNGFFLNGPTSNWVAPGATVGVCGGAAPNIRLLGTASLCILDGDASPSAADGTDFGFYAAPGIDRTFTITNNGSGTLNISGINISGPDASWFTVIAGPVLTSLAPGQSTTFTVRFSGIGLGVRNAIITVVNDDADETNYDFAVQGEGTISVPVTLLNFSGSADTKVVNLSWRTANELNNQGFEVQRSDARQTEWTKIGFVPASGQSASNYGITDFTPLYGTNTYRLKQTDLDGRISYSNVLAFNFNVKGSVVRTYPNPFTTGFVLAFNDPALINTRAEITSISGARIATVILNSYNQNVDLSRFGPGIYLVKLANGEVVKLIKR